MLSFLCQQTTLHCSRLLLNAVLLRHPVATTTDRYLLPTGPTAANPPQQHAGVDRWDRQTDRQVDRVLLHRPCHILCEQCQQSVSNHTDLTHSLFIIKLKSTIVTHSDQALVTNVRYCHCAACTLSTQRLATVPTVMLNKQSIAQFHFESQASETIINYFI